MQKLGRIGLGMLLGASLLLSGCANQQENHLDIPELLPPAGVELDYATATVMDLETIYTYSSAVVPEVEELYFTVDGTVLRNHISLGQRVQKGDVLIALDEEDLRKEYTNTADTLAYLRKTYANQDKTEDLNAQIATLRLTELIQSGAAEAEILRMQGEIDMEALKVRQAREERNVTLAETEEKLLQIEEKLGQNQLIAPCDGTVVYLKDLREEYEVSAYDVVVRIADESRLHLSGEFITESSVRSAHEVYALIGDSRYSVRYMPVDMEEYLSTIFAGGTLHTQFSFAEVPDDVACGEYAAVCISAGYTPDALCIPVNALYSDSAGRYVYKLLEDGTRTRQNVHTGVNNRLYVQITEGLAEGDRVYVKE